MLLLDAHPVLEPEEIAEISRVVAFALSRLHAAGQVHGAVDAQHISVDESGAVSLLPAHADPVVEPVPGAYASDRRPDQHGAVPSSRAVPAGPADGSPEADVRALGELILDLLALCRPESSAPTGAALPPRSSRPRSPADRALRRLPAVGRRRVGSQNSPAPAREALAAIARQACPDDGSRPPSAATIAAHIALRVPNARPPGRRPPSPDPALSQATAAAPPLTDNPWLRRGAVAVAMLVVFVVVGTATTALQQRRVRVAQPAPEDLISAASTPTTAPPMASRVWPAVEFHNGVLESAHGRFTVGSPEDVVVAGDWFCRREVLPALLRPPTGEVFVFDRWPGDSEEVVGRAVGTVPGAVSLQALGSDDRPCPTLLALLATGEQVPLPVSAEAGP